MKTVLLLLVATLAAGASAQTTNNQTNSPAPAKPKSAEKPPADTAKPADAIPKSVETQPATAASPSVANAGGTNAPGRIPDTLLDPDRGGLDAWQQFDRSLSPKTTAHRKASLQDQGIKTDAGRGVSADGILIKVVKTDNPLQLINPFAPLDYGWGQETTDPAVTKHTDGLGFFSLRF